MIHYSIVGTILSGIAVYTFLAQLGDLLFNAAAWMLKVLMAPEGGNIFTNFNFYTPTSANGNPFLGLVMPYFYGNGTTDAGYNLFRICWMLFAILAALQILKTFRDPAARGNASPGRSLIWILISAGLMVGGHLLLEGLLSVFSTFMQNFAGSISGSITSLDDANLLSEFGILSEPSDYVLTCIVSAGLATTTIAAGITYIERYLSFAVTAYLAPIAFACASNDDMRDTFKLWAQSMLEQALGIFLSVAMLALAMKALTTPDTYFDSFKADFWTNSALSISLLKCTSATVILGFCRNIEKFLNVIGFKTMPNGDAAKSFLAGAGAVASAWSLGNSMVSPFANRADDLLGPKVGTKLADAATKGGVGGAIAKAASNVHDFNHPGERTARNAAAAEAVAKATSPSKLDGKGRITRNPNSGDPRQNASVDKLRSATEAIDANGGKVKGANLKDSQMSSEAMAKATMSPNALNESAKAGQVYDSTKPAEFATDSKGNQYGVMHGHGNDGDFIACTPLKNADGSSDAHMPADGEVLTAGKNQYKYNANTGMLEKYDPSKSDTHTTTSAADAYHGTGSSGAGAGVGSGAGSVPPTSGAPDTGKPGNAQPSGSASDSASSAASVATQLPYDTSAQPRFESYFDPGKQTATGAQPKANTGLNQQSFENSGYGNVQTDGNTITMTGQLDMPNMKVEGEPIQPQDVTISYNSDTGTGTVTMPNGTEKNVAFAQDPSGAVHAVYDNSVVHAGDKASNAAAADTVQVHSIKEISPVQPAAHAGGASSQPQTSPNAQPVNDAGPAVNPDRGAAAEIKENRKNEKKNKA